MIIESAADGAGLTGPPRVAGPLDQLSAAATGPAGPAGSSRRAGPTRPAGGATGAGPGRPAQIGLPGVTWTARLAQSVSFSRIGAVYVWIAISVIFAFWAPATFPNLATAKQILNSSAITALAALSITIPLAARVFDLSFAYTMTLTGVVSARLVAGGMPVLPALLIGLASGVLVGLINAVVVVVMRIDSFIGTLATGSLIQALITMATGGTPIVDIRLNGAFSKIGQPTFLGLQYPVFYVAVVALAMWFLLEHTATGRRLYATGFNPDAARLAGVRVNRLRFASLAGSGTLAGAAGLVLASLLSSGSPTVGTSYLLPAFAAAFLGATQLKHGRFNAGGTLIAVLLLGTGTTGLALANAPQWSSDMFVGVVLIASLAVTGVQRRAAGASPGGLIRRLRNLTRL